MFLELHDEHKIGYKTLSAPDLGAKSSSHQTHIGLFGDVLTFLPDKDKISENSILIYNGSFEYIDVYFDRIKNPDGTYRSPKIRIGERNTISIARTIRAIAQTTQANKWFLLWFGLKSEKIVFFLFNEASEDYAFFATLGIDLENKKKDTLEDESTINTLVHYLESKIGATASKDLEVAVQVDSTPGRQFKKYDIEKASENFRKIGKLGEALINDFLSKKRENKEIDNFHWYNEEIENGLPYDFHIENLNGSIIYLDVKTTNYNFETEMVFSNQEIAFISETNCGYSVYRVYKKDENIFSLRICDDCKGLSSEINELTNDYKQSLHQAKTNLRSAKFAISPDIDKFSFEPEILLDLG